MVLDILCPGDWQDSYESRYLSDGSYNIEVNNIHDVLNAVKNYFSSPFGKDSLSLFKSFDLYLDGSLFGEYIDGQVIVFPKIKWDNTTRSSEIKGWYTHGRNEFILPVDLCLNYGINRKTVKVGKSWD